MTFLVLLGVLNSCSLSSAWRPAGGDAAPIEVSYTPNAAGVALVQTTSRNASSSFVEKNGTKVVQLQSKSDEDGTKDAQMQNESDEAPGDGDLDEDERLGFLEDDPAPPDKLTLTCPEGLRPGQTFTATMPDGKNVYVLVPSRDAKNQPMKSGATFTFVYDDSTPEAPPNQTPQQSATARSEADLYKTTNSQRRTTKVTGQELRGILDAFGVAWALKLNKGDCKPQKVGMFGKSTYKEKGRYTSLSYTKFICRMSVKLLRFNPDKRFPSTVVDSDERKMKPKLVSMLNDGNGWKEDAISLFGWFQPETGHFQGYAKRSRMPEYKKAKWVAFAFIPWRKFEIRFDADGANFWIQWKEGANALWGTRRMRYQTKPFSRVFRLDAKEDVTQDQLKTIWVSGLLPIRRAQVVLTTKMYEWRVPDPRRPDFAEGTIYMKMMDVVHGDKDKDKKLLERWSATPEGTPVPWFVYNQERGAWKFIVQPDGKLLKEGNLMYNMAKQSTSCLSGWSNRGDATTPCPWIDTFFDRYAVKFTDEELILRPLDVKTITTVSSKSSKSRSSSGSIAGSGFDLGLSTMFLMSMLQVKENVTVAGKGPSKKKPTSTTEDFSNLRMYPIFDDDALEAWSGSDNSADSNRLSQYGVVPKEQSPNSAAAAPGQPQVAQVVQATATRSPTDKLNNYKTVVKRQEQAITDLTRETMELKAMNVAMKVAMQPLTNNLARAKVTLSRFGAEERRLEDRESRTQKELTNLYDEQTLVLGKDGATTEKLGAFLRQREGTASALNAAMQDQRPTKEKYNELMSFNSSVLNFEPPQPAQPAGAGHGGIFGQTPYPAQPPMAAHGGVFGPTPFQAPPPMAAHGGMFGPRPQPMATHGNVFGPTAYQASPPMGPHGGMPFQGPPPMAAHGNVFGPTPFQAQPPIAAHGGAFGQNPAQPPMAAHGNVFGPTSYQASPPMAAHGGMFGQGPQPMAAHGGMFGHGSMYNQTPFQAQPPMAGHGNVFGQTPYPAQPPMAAHGNVFGPTPYQATPPMAAHGGMPGQGPQPMAAHGNVFGQTPFQAQPPMHGGMFGQTPYPQYPQGRPGY